MNKKMQVLLTPENHETIDLTIEINGSNGMVNASFHAPEYIINDQTALVTLIQSMHDTMEMITDEPVDIEVLHPEVVKYDETLDILITALAVLDAE